MCECDLFVERINSDSKVFEAIKPPLDNFFKMAIFPKLFCGIQNQENTASASHTADKYCHCKGPEQVKWWHAITVTVRLNGSIFNVLALLKNQGDCGTAVKLAS